MARHVERPLVFPMSNPTSQSEARPCDLLAWTGGRALVATGSPFEPVRFDGRDVAFGQGNNAFVFPGVGLGVMVSGAIEVTDAMFSAAARQLASEVDASDLAEGRLFPRVRDLRRISAAIARAVAREAVSSGLGRSLTDEQIARAVAGAMWEPGSEAGPPPVG